MKKEGLDFRPAGGLKIWPEDSCLLSRLRDELTDLHGKKMAEVLVILPTQRLATCLLAMLAQKTGACHPPKICTWEQFLRDLVPEDRSPEDSRLQVSDETFELLIGAFIRTGTFRHLDLSHAHELKQLYLDMTEHSLPEDCLRSLQERLREDVYRDDTHIRHLNDRLEEMHRVFESVGKALREKSLETGLTRLKHRCAGLLRGGCLNEFRHVYIACFTTVRVCFRDTWKEMAGLPHVSLWFTQAPEILARTSPLGELLAFLRGDRAGENSRKFPRSAGQEKPSGHVGIHSCASGVEEVARAIELAQQYIEGGCPPSQVAILLTSETRYGKLLKTFVRELKLKANIAVSTSLAQTLAGSWLSSLMEWWEASADNQPATCLSFLTHRVTLNWIVAQLQPAEDSREFREGLCLLLAEGIAGSSDARKFPWENLADGALRVVMEKLHSLLKPVLQVQERPSAQRLGLRDRASLLDKLISDLGLWNLQDEADGGVTRSSLQALAGLMDALLETGDIVNPGLSGGEFFSLIREKMRSLETRGIGYPLRGIQVLSLTEARFIPIQAAVILGCNEGLFPRALPSDYLLDDWLKGRLGLPGWQYIEALEDTTFQLFQARIPFLELLYSRESGNVPAVRSRFIEKLLHSIPGLQVQTTQDLVFRSIFSSGENQARCSRQSFSRKADTLGLMFPDPLALLMEVSAGKLETLIHCPYRFALDQVLPACDPDQKNSSLQEGLLLHKVLELFFRGSQHGPPEIKEPLPETMPLKTWQDISLRRLETLTDAVFSGEASVLPLKTHLLEYSWPVLCGEMEKLFLSWGDGVSFLRLPAFRLYEWPLGKSQGVMVDSMTLFPKASTRTEILIRGTVDRLEGHDGRFAVTDYKRKKLPSGSEVRSGLRPQLPLYALALSRDPMIRADFRIAHTSLIYWSLLDGEVFTVSCGETDPKAPGARTKLPLTADLVSNMLERWQKRFVDLSDLKRPFLPEPGLACSFCRWEGVCRKSEPGMKQILKSAMESGGGSGD